MKMIGLVAAAAGGWMALAAGASAQVQVTNADGSTVRLGPGGVDVHEASGRVVTVRHSSVTTTRPGARGAGSASCPDGRLEVSGTRADLRVAGPCREVAISGSRNTVRVRLAPGARVELSGTGNTLVWTLADPKGAPPHIQNAGTGNQDRRG